LHLLLGRLIVGIVRLPAARKFPAARIEVRIAGSFV